LGVKIDIEQYRFSLNKEWNNMSKIDYIGKDDFESLIKDGTVMIKFGAEWCAPCRAMDPMLEEIAAELPADCKIYKIDIDDHPDIAATYKVKTIPNLIVFKGGQVYKTQIGRTSKENVLRLFE